MTKTYIIAEISANHLQSFETAEKLIVSAKGAGADAVKVQCFTPDTLTIDSRDKGFLVSTGMPWEGRPLYDLYKEATMPWNWIPRLMDLAKTFELDFFSSVYDKTSVDFMEKLNPPYLKIASFELVDLELLKYAAQTKITLILSTGMATFEEILDAQVAIESKTYKKPILLKCISSYPAPLEDTNLLSIRALGYETGLRIGLSDHTEGTSLAPLAVAAGARVIEKHLTLFRSLGGPDSSFSLEPPEFADMVDIIRFADTVVGDIQFGPTKSEMPSLRLRRSLFATEDIPLGGYLSPDNVGTFRPALGLPPKFYSVLMGKVAVRDIPKGGPILLGDAL